jgi:hypothetical protein
MSSKIKKKGKFAQELNSSNDNSDLKKENSTKKSQIERVLKGKMKAK